MSTRYMKKVYGGVALPENDSESENEPENLIIHDAKSKTFNLFDVLNQNSETAEKESEEQQDVDEDKANDEVKRKKKKKRRRKVDGVKAQQTIEHTEVEVADEIERSIREVFGDPLPGCSSQDTNNLQWIEQRSKEDVLLVQHKHLNPYNELKKMFGSKTVQAEQNNRRNRPRSGHLKKTWLVSARDNWPPINKSGLSMSLDQTMVSTGGNIQYFVYEHDPSYRQVQLKFLEAVESLNPENIVNIINAHSYHVDALLQLAELCELNEDLAMAAEFTERALYCLECAFHPLFNVTTGLCRLDYKKQQNRALYITLFKHLNFVGGRACYRTSLEFCKLLLSLDPEGDPLAAVLTIDFYALRAKEYEWFIEFCDLWDSTTHLTQLPNIAYSLALAHFHLGNETWASGLLRDAVLMFPEVLMLLLDKCSIQTDEKVRNHEYFKNKTSNIPALEKLEQLYVARNFRLWKEADLLPWLRENVHAVLNRVDSKDVYIKYCERKRIEHYHGKLPKNILRHIILSDIKDVTVNVQEVQNDGSVLSHDPLPPTDSIDIYKRPTATTRSTRSSANALSLFISSLVSNIHEETVVVALDGLNLFYDHNEQT